MALEETSVNCDEYKRSLYQQSWENYRNEDNNYRTILGHYLVFAGALTVVAIQGKNVPFFVGIFGSIVSVGIAFYLLRVSVYSTRWLRAKDSAILPTNAKEEIEYLNLALKEHGFAGRFASMTGHLVVVLVPIAGFVFFGIMCCWCYMGHGFFGVRP